MKLQPIDKVRYRKHLNMASVVATAVLIAFALFYGQVLIHFFAGPDENNFKLNLAGVILGVISLLVVFNLIRRHSYLVEVMYVWDLKQENNKIYRKLHHIKTALSDSGNTNIDAITILNYYYSASKQQYNLDNNTLTMEGLMADIAILDNLIAENNLTITLDDYNSSLLKQF
ncbi:DUF3087 family protein [Moritella viscosa]|uniref:DUF3087 domain-containing protein n=1 Tax=Moritella viscosa TaxID=80854 RepID=A0ABY1HAA4_9GAMM|nr:DUF3087 family protein [Moritella viscosa]CED61213.1 membrane protein [Moritella viscosa]SGY88016.1 Putative uncharacterized protein [Moritella viscosa]SGY94729.1 Putative uncharacterized protein [Moritella viscosa]SHO04324.1 Putative uncharacterized protein [Moritella viscosa]SHO21146.1 Putative uncharacterized protein [Moritella viscosa]